MVRLICIGFMALALSACWPVQQMEANRVRRKVAAYEAANPEKPVTPALISQFEAEAKAEVEAEIQAEKAEALKKGIGAGAQIATGVATGNPVAMGTGAALVVGAILAYFGIARKGANGVLPKKEA
jgi:ABC-type thiamine transport system substrate-binding protein